MEIMGDKAALRNKLLVERAGFSDADRQRADAAIAAHVLAWWEANPVPVLGVYWPMRKEPDLRVAYDTLAARGVRLSLPVVDAADAPLRFRAWQPGEALQKDSMGVWVPLPQAAGVRPDALLIPCLGYTAGRFRLGYGGGFYDRTLAAMPGVQTVGIAYAAALVSFAAGPHDIALGRIITEGG